MPTNFEILNRMSEDDSPDIESAGLDNIVHMQICKAGAQITFGVPRHVMDQITLGQAVGCFVIADKETFEATRKKMVDELRAQKDGD